MRVVVLTHLASPYQAELFDALANSRQLDLEVIYLFQTDDQRRWSAPAVKHQAVYLDQSANVFQQAQRAVQSADLVVFNYYAEFSARRLLEARARVGAPWCFWGERPGLRRPAWIGRLLRRYLLAELHQAPAPIWGIGNYALEGYRAEFGLQRSYFNLPYFSDLERFHNARQTTEREPGRRRFLFSGALSERKGVDLLARAFVRLAQELPQIELMILGDGKLRGALMKTIEPVKNRVAVLGFRDWSELPAVYAVGDILCAPSRYDGWGLVVPEGLASGMPVIGTRATGAALEFITTARNGWLIPADNEAALFDAMRQAALLAPEQLVQMGRQARTSVAHHSLQNGVDRFVAAARDALASWQA